MIQPCRLLRWTLAFVLVVALPSSALAQKHWHLAEGATGPFFEMDILIGNPNSTPANVSINYLLPSGLTVQQELVVAPTSRATVRVNNVAGLQNVSALSAVVSSDADIVVERSMYWVGGQKVGGHNSRGVQAAATEWFLAEGANGFFETFILLSNPDPSTTANVSLTFLKEDGSTVPLNTDVPPSSRVTVDTSAVPGLGNVAFSTRVASTNGVGIIVERAMYWAGFEGGHASAGLTSTSTTWAFGEGFTGTAFNGAIGFDTFLLLANPGNTAAAVTVLFLPEAGSPIVFPVTVGPNSRRTIWVGHQVPGLSNAAFSIAVQSSVPILAERSMYWGPGHWIDGHNSPGITALATAWAFAEGVQGGAEGTFFDSYFLIANPNPSPLHLEVTFLREDGTGIVVPLFVSGLSRFTLMPSWYGELSNQRFATFIRSTDGQGFIAERAVYWGHQYRGGHNNPGTPWSGSIAAPPEPPGPAVSSISPATGTANGGTFVTITGSNFAQGATVTIGGVPASSVQVIDSTRITAITGARAAGPADVIVTSNGQAAMLLNGFTYTEPGPPPPPPPAPNRTPDPPAGQRLPLPNMFHIVVEVANQFPGALHNSCQSHGGSWEFMDRLVDRLRQIDTRWGYNWKRGVVGDPSHDVIAYHWGGGPDEGSINVYLIDVIVSHCGSSPQPTWINVTDLTFSGGSIGRWTARGRF